MLLTDFLDGYVKYVRTVYYHRPFPVSIVCAENASCVCIESALLVSSEVHGRGDVTGRQPGLHIS